MIVRPLWTTLHLASLQLNKKKTSGSEALVSFTDNDDFVIPSLGIGELDLAGGKAPEIDTPSPSSPKAKKEETIYLGPHGAPPSQSKIQTVNSSGRKQRLKQKLKEADKRIFGSGRENKLENIKELVGGGKASSTMSKGSSRDWLDPHCQESQFEKWCPQ